MAQRFHVYDAALALVVALRPVLERLKQQDRGLVDQLRRLVLFAEHRIDRANVHPRWAPRRVGSEL